MHSNLGFMIPGVTSVRIAGEVGGSTPQLMSSTPLVVLLCLSWGVRNNPHRSRSVIVGIHSLHVLLRRTVLLCYWNGNKIAVLLYYNMVYCVQHWLCALYSPASNPLWGGVMFLCKRVATFPFVTHLNTWPFDRTRDELTSKYSTHVRRAPAVKTELLQWLYLGHLWLKLWRANYT